MKKIYLLSLIILLLFSGCGDDHSHDEHSHDNHSHDSHPHDRSKVDIELEPIAITHYTKETELFVEFEPFVVGEPSRFLAHFTNMNNFKAFKKGSVEACLKFVNKKECFSVNAPAREGIFIPIATPIQTGDANLSISITLDGNTTIHKLGIFKVYDSKRQVVVSTHEEDDDSISYLKEQQWQVQFATQIVKKHILKESIPTFVTIEIPANAQHLLSAPVSGIITPNKEIRVGTEVKKNQTIAYITPLLGEKEDLSTLKFELKKAQSNLSLAKSERKRLKKLEAHNAVSQKRIMMSKQDLEITKAHLSNIKQRLKQFDPDSSEESGIPLKSPITGTIARQIALGGSYINEGDLIMHIVNPKKLWLNVAIAQSDVFKIQNPLGVEVVVQGNSLNFFVQDNAKFIYFSDIIDSKSRTASLVFEIENPPSYLKAGARFVANVYTGKTLEALAIPKSAIINDNGQRVVYVLVSGESVERRNVKLGLSDGKYIEVYSGVNDGERVISKGAYEVLLSSLSPAEAGHGHAH